MPKQSTRRGTGTTRTVHGREMVFKPDHPRAQKHGYVFRAIVIAEALLGRSLLPGEVVHHANEVTDDDRPENLVVMADAAHKSLHARKREAWRNIRGKKLTERAAGAIRGSQEPTGVLARRFGVSPRTIQHIRSGKTWR